MRPDKSMANGSGSRAVIVLCGVVWLGSAAGCLGNGSFDLEVARTSALRVSVTHSAGGSATASLVAHPEDPYGCYELEPELRVTGNGQPARSVSIVEGEPGHGTIGCIARWLTASFDVPAGATSLLIEFSQDGARSVMDVALPAHPALALTWSPAPEARSGDLFWADLIPVSGPAMDVPAGETCWHAWFCAAGATVPCASNFDVGTSAEPSPQGARLSFRFFDLAAGERSLWLGPSADTGVCAALSGMQCNGFAECTASTDNYGYLLGPYPFRVF